MRLILLRHAKCEGMDASVINGYNDVKLVEEGIEQAKIVADKLYDVLNGKVTKIYSSYLTRAIQTATIVKEKFGIAELEYDMRLNERHFGFFQEMNRYQARDYDTYSTINEEKFDIYMKPQPLAEEKHLQEVKNFAKKLNINEEKALEFVPNGESIVDAENRVISFLNELLQSEDAQSTVIVVSHSNIIKLMIKQIEKMDYAKLKEINVKPCDYTIYNLNVYGNSAFNISAR